MAGTKIYMTAERKHALSDIHAAIHYIEGAEEVFSQEMCFGNGTALLLVYEKYFSA